MSSPFPGMDPYLEAHWGDVHSRLITYARDQLRSQLPPDLQARVEERVTVQAWNGAAHGMYPDVRVIERPAPRESAGLAVAEVTIAEPLIVPRELEEVTHRSIQIIDSRSGNRVVTAIEFLSHAKKSNERGRTLYRSKQEDLLEGGVNLVEIDLLREGAWVLAVYPQAVPTEFCSPYRICIVRATRPNVAELYRASFRQPLPTIPIPLRPTDKDVHLNLQAIVALACENGGYDDIDYRVAPFPPLDGTDAEWADARLREQGRRQ